MYCRISFDISAQFALFILDILFICFLYYEYVHGEFISLLSGSLRAVLKDIDSCVHVIEFLCDNVRYIISINSAY
jgi:hypothetical protein